MSHAHLPGPARRLLAVALAFALTGCAHTIRVGGRRDLHLALTEFRVTPDTVRAYAGPLTITVRNVGTRTHDLAVSLGNQNEVVSPDLAPGATATMTVYLAPGSYMLRSLLSDDQALGLWGTLDVVAIHKG